MKKPESPCLDCADRSLGCHAPGACPAEYSYDQYCKDLTEYWKKIKSAKADEHMTVTDSKRFTRRKKQWYKKG